MLHQGCLQQAVTRCRAMHCINCCLGPSTAQVACSEIVEVHGEAFFVALCCILA